MQEFLINLMTKVLNQSDAKVDNYSLRRFNLFAFHVVQEFMHDFSLVKDEKRVAETEVLNVTEDFVELSRVVLELLRPHQLNEVGCGHIVMLQAILAYDPLLKATTLLIVLQVIKHLTLEAER